MFGLVTSTGWASGVRIGAHAISIPSATNAPLPQQRIEANPSSLSESAAETQCGNRDPAIHAIGLFGQKLLVDVGFVERRVVFYTDIQDASDADAERQVVGVVDHPAVADLGEDVVRVSPELVELAV